MAEESDAVRQGSPAAAPALAPAPARTGVRVLSVDGRPAARAMVHVVGVAGLVSVVLAVTLGWTAVAVLALVLGGLTLVRVLAVPAGLQAVLGASLLGAAWVAVLGLYEEIWWADIVAHLVVTGALAAVSAVLLRRAGMAPPVTTTRRRWAMVVLTTTVGTSLGVLWEIVEWVGYTYIDDSIYVTYGDTIGDLAAGALGSLVAGVVLARRRDDRAERHLGG